ncbi:Ground-like domain-containing protein, partial [Meloidogyne graminicola]
ADIEHVNRICSCSEPHCLDSNPHCQQPNKRVLRQVTLDSDEDATGGGIATEQNNFDMEGAKEEENSPDTMMVYDDDSPVTEEAEEIKTTTNNQQQTTNTIKPFESTIKSETTTKNIGSRPSIAKRKIQSKVTEQLGGRIDVICSRKAFSYVVNSEIFCEVEKSDIVCLCYKQQG